MRTFIASLCAFALLLLLIAWNARFVNAAMDELEHGIRSLPSCESANTQLEHIDTQWQKRRKVISLSVSYNELREMDVCLTQMRAAVKEQDALQFETARLMALDTIMDIRRLERITLINIL